MLFSFFMNVMYDYAQPDDIRSNLFFMHNVIGDCICPQSFLSGDRFSLEN